MKIIITVKRILCPMPYSRKFFVIIALPFVLSSCFPVVDAPLLSNMPRADVHHNAQQLEAYRKETEQVKIQLEKQAEGLQ